MNKFDEYVQREIGKPLDAKTLDKIQVNITLKCNIECKHCHVASSPRRTESMTRETMDQVLDLVERVDPDQVDLTGGAPEIHPNFRWFVKKIRERNVDVLVRTNLVILLEDGYEDMPEFFRDQDVQLVASLPCYEEENVDEQRGEGTYNDSIRALQILNETGYGVDSNLPLDLVYNPVGAHLPPDQAGLEEKYKDELSERFDIQFHNLLTITNMPIGMFLHQLRQNDELEDYRQLLRDNFNPDTLDGLMCRNQINIRYDGRLYDCDFNLAEDMPVSNGEPRNVRDVSVEDLLDRDIETARHCFGCTAGSGSSCGGSIT